MDYFKQQIDQWADWQAAAATPAAFEALIQQIYRSENEPFKTPELVETAFTATFSVGATQIAIFPPTSVAAQTRDRYQTEKFSLARLARLQLTGPTLLHAGFIFDRYQFYYVIYRPLVGISLTEFINTAEPLAKSTLGRQIGTALRQLNGEVADFNRVKVSELANQAAWSDLGPTFAAERESYLATHPVAKSCFVHGQLNGENIIVTTGKVGFRQFQTAMVGPAETELVPLVLQAFDGDSDCLAGLQETLKLPDLVSSLLIGLFWRADGPAQIKQVMGADQVTLTTLTQRLTQLVKHESEG
ncbi:phosphotransferase [Lactiplantibacillus daoliensis]|uniref:Phosphotransferase n=1 Tax=Lactiplantibacillus daoliensis TaxID=2559916 RepID=A0ABW1UGS0_9LACO|nr:phosphotransferase [Lactiplantibacillus daoliensis]